MLVISFFRHFLFQAILYMSWPERIFKLSITGIVALLFFILGFNLITSILLGHLINFVGNSHIPVVLRKIPMLNLMSIKKLSLFYDFILKLHQRNNLESITIYGSYTSRKLNYTSDLDLRIFYDRKNTFDIIRICIICIKIRLWGFLNMFPVEIYAYGSTKFLEKLNPNERPYKLIHQNLIVKEDDFLNVILGE